MINLPNSLNTEIKKLYGVNPLIVIEVDWANDITGSIVTNRYSTQEFTNLTTYRYIKEYSNVEIVNHVQGLGQVNSISVTAIDDFGHFKERLDMKNVYRIEQVARVYLGAATSPTTISELMLLFTGRMEEVEWHEQDKEVTFDIISDPVDIVIGFTPNIEMIDPNDSNFELFNGWLNPKTWPRVYGTVIRFEAVPLTTVGAQIEVEDSAEYVTDGTGGPFDDIPINNKAAVFLEFGVGIGEHWIFAKDDILAATGKFVTDGINAVAYRPITITNRLWEPETPEVVTVISSNIIEFDDPPPIPLKGMMMFMRFTFGFGFVQLPIRIVNSGFIDGKMRANINIHMFFSSSTVVSIIYVGKNLFTPTTIDSKYRIMPKDKTIFQSYIINTAGDTTVIGIQTEDEDGVRLIPATDYTVKNTAIDGKFWNAASGFDNHPVATYIEFNPESFFDYYEDFVAGNNITEGMLVSMSTSKNTEVEALRDLIFLAGLTPDTTLVSSNRTVSFVLDEEEDFLDIISDIAWQGGKALRHHNGKIQVIDLLDLPNSSKTIQDNQTVLNSLIYAFSPVEEVFTKFKFTLQTLDVRGELVEFTVERNTDKYKERVFEADFFIYENRSSAQDIIDYWVNRLSEAYHQLEIRTTIENLALEVWDTIDIQLGNLNFQDSSETFLTNVLTGSSISWDGRGTIKEISLDWENLEVTIIMRFAARISTI